MASNKTRNVSNSNPGKSVDVPVGLFRDRSLAALEIMVEYLHDDKKLAFCEIAKLLNRDDRTIWTVYNRAKKKRRQT